MVIVVSLVLCLCALVYAPFVLAVAEAKLFGTAHIEHFFSHLGLRDFLDRFYEKTVWFLMA